MIKLVNLNKEYKDKKIFKNLNLEINKGEIIGLLAPNAEGKSTLLKILGGQITFDSGEYFFNGEEFTYKNKEVIGYMNDTSIIPPSWKVRDGIEYYNEYFKTFNEEKCLEMLKHFEIDLKRKVKTLSKGENEKYHLSLALAIEGQLYIMDEPLAAIDLIAREEVISMILDNFNIDSTIIISSHLVSDIERMLDRVLLLKGGEIVVNKLVEDLRVDGKSVVDLYKEVYENVQV
ncbi:MULTISPECIES: ABC transporter ATP-binding protein [unclassified Clostridium]|jgi:ABC-2 type transport system ATP-binding protein|uniref:ATP-binding cassette domain-containing protein n=1 Tax=Clostridium TaxID=1485 RepID=UPI001C8B2F9A|nr:MULTISPECIES: ABC transporter ATP-binding protein [unclassified Clostridium]MBX9137824.1 ABC transporter ATP-binding protein [Clostridium sp. K12(2020)]MBX9143521.1 ABC transporter ATP-binding protein [Clostridium sp. K13]MDU2288559.1 ABC transporter ATP-binding protein [Clostridium celatum]MDU4326056.1 ABC transporter ATP-binding protein [Clostridium celatum]